MTFIVSENPFSLFLFFMNLEVTKKIHYLKRSVGAKKEINETINAYGRNPFFFFFFFFFCLRELRPVSNATIHRISKSTTSFCIKFYTHGSFILLNMINTSEI
jgi:hypothetical protein